MLVEFKGKKLEITEIDHGGDSCDSFITDAYWVDSEIDLGIDELELLTEDCGDVIYEDWLDNRISAAEDMADSYAD